MAGWDLNPAAQGRADEARCDLNLDAIPEKDAESVVPAWRGPVTGAGVLGDKAGGGGQALGRDLKEPAVVEVALDFPGEVQSLGSLSPVPVALPRPGFPYPPR